MMGDRSEWVGQRVRVFWEDEDEWFSGVVQDVDESQRVFVLYEDGDERWEDETQQMEVVPSVRSAAAPAIMEPPASPGYEDEYEDEDEDTEKEEIVDALDDDVRGFEHREHDAQDQTENISDPEDINAEQADQEAELPDHALDNPTDKKIDPSDHEDSQSIAMSEAPLMFDKRPNQPEPSASQLPISGILHGLVLRASNLSREDPSDRPNAFVRIAFVEAGETNNTNLMLRCKNALASTSVISRSSHPIWNEDDEATEGDGVFKLQLAPFDTAPEQRRSWFQLRGDLLFTVYSSSSSGSSGNDFIGQALLSLQNVLREVLIASPCVTRHLGLRSRQGRPLAGNGSDSAPPELVVSFHFLPIYEPDLKLKSSTLPSNPRKSFTMASVRSCGTRKATLTAATRNPPEHIRRLNAHRSSSSINRRKFEKQVEQDNKAFAKKLQSNQVRQVRRFAQIKAEEKQRKVPPQRGSMTYSHKASSHVNRNKFQYQVDLENKAIEKRLHAIVRNTESFGRKACWGAQAKDHEDEDEDPDKVYVRDRRQRKQAEKDYTMEKAQAKYQQQNQVVERILALQQSIANQKTQIFATKTSATRLGILNKKDQHLLDCLRNAVDKAATTTKPVLSVSKKAKSRDSDSARDADFANGSIRRERKELELLLQEETALKNGLKQCSQELATVTQEEKSLELEVSDLESKLRFVQSKQKFQQRMSGRDAHIMEREMKSKQRQMELSRDEEDQWTVFQAHQELLQLQITVQILTDRLEGDCSAKRSGACSSLSAVNEYLAKKIEKNQSKLTKLQLELNEWQTKYEALVVSGDQERLQKQIQELQHVLFLCQTRAKQTKAAERQARVAADRVTTKFQGQLFHEQTETEILLKKKS